MQATQSEISPQPNPEPSNEIVHKIAQYIVENPVCVFMKGTKKYPECNFSKTVCRILKFYGVTFKDINVMADANLRQGVKDFSHWPTIPQVYIKEEFIGGLDIIKEMHED